MPIYEFKGQQYDIATDDPAAAKAKILSYLGSQEPAPAKKPVPVAASDEYDFGSPLGSGSSEIMAVAGPRKTTTKGLDIGAVPEQFASGVAGMQQGYYATAAKNVGTALNVMDRIDKGERVPDTQDPTGYQYLNPEQRAQVRSQFKKAFTGNVAKTIAYGAEQQGYVKNPNAEAMVKAANKEDWGKAWKAFSDDPAGVIQQLTVQSAPNALPSLIGGAAGVLLRGGVPAMMAGLGTGSFPVEYMSSIVDSLQDAKVDMKDAEAVEAKLRDPKFLEDAGKKAVTRATVISAADAASGKLLMPFRAGQVGKNVARGGANIIAEVGTEMGGEAGAQIASGETLKVGDIIAEGLGAGPQAVATTALKTVENARKEPEAATPPPPAPPAEEPKSTAAQADQIRADRIAALTDVYTKQGIPADNAGRIAERKVDAELKAENKTAAIKVPEGRVEEIAQDLIAAGVPPQQAAIDAKLLAQEEAKADELAQAEAGGTPNVAEPVSEPIGAGPSVAGQPSAEPTTERTGVDESSGMVRTGQTATDVTTGAGVEPTALTEAPAPAPVEETPAPAPEPTVEEAPKETTLTAEEELDKKSRAETQSLSFDELRAKTKEGVSAPGTMYTATHKETDTDLEGNKVTTPVSKDYKVVRMDGGWTVVAGADGSNPVLLPPVRAAANTDEQLVEQQNNKLTFTQDTVVTPTKTEGAELGTETPQAIEAAQEGQAAPTTAIAKGKRGRPPVKQTHVVVPTADGKFEHVANGEVMGSYANKKQATAAVNLAKAKDKGDAALIATNQAKLDAALASTGRGRPAKATTEAGTAELDKETKVEMNALESALDTYNSPDSNKASIASAAEYINDAASDATLPKPVRERAKQMLEEDIDPRDIPKKLRSTEKNVGKADTGFNNATTGAQAIAQVIKTGNAFQRYVAQRIRNYLNGVKFVVLEVGDTIPKEMKNARGLFVYDAKAKTRTVYVRGASFGAGQGVNNITVLHELLHAATAQRIGLSLIKGFQNFQLKLFKREMQALAKRVQEAYEIDLAIGELSPEMRDLVNGTLVVDEATGKASYEIFSSPDEFLAYGMSSPVFQRFLMGIKGKQTEATGFSSFVKNIRDLFGIQEGTATAFSDLVNITDKMLSTRMEAVPASEQKSKSLRQADNIKPTEFDEKADLRAKRSALELERDARKAKQKVAESREGDVATAVAAMQKERDPSKVRQILANAWSTMDYAQREATVRLPTFDFLAKWAAEKGINALTNTNMYLERMLGMSQQFLAGAEQVVGMLDRGFKEDPNLSRAAFEDFVYATTIAEIDPSDVNAVERSKTLDADYKALGPVGQRMYKALKDYYESIIELYSDLLDAQIQNAQGLTQEDKNNLMAMLRKTFEAKARIRPYFPLVRRGDFWLAIGKGEKRRFYTFESRIERNNKAAELAAHKGDDVEDLLFRQEFVQGNDLGSLRTASKDSSQMLKQTFDAIDKMNMGENSAEAKEGLKDAVYQIYLSSMPEQTFRKQFTHRKNRTGFSTDVRRNVATTAAKQATQLARLKYAPLLRNSLSAARDSILEQEELSPFVREAEKRVNLALSGGSSALGDAVAGAANKASFFWYLSSPASALIQPSSIFISGLPVLAGNYSVSGAATELAKMTVLVNQYSMLRVNSDGTTSIAAPSIANNKSLPEDERKAVSEMVSRGVSQSTYASLVWGYKQTPTDSMYFGLNKGWGNIPVAYGKGKRLGSFLVGALMHNTERLSREAVYLAAYRLGKKAGLSYEEAVQKAVDSTNEALGNYDISNKPRFMQEGIGKVAFQFKMYPLQMTLLMLTNLKKMMPFLNKEGKKEAATKFFGMMGTSGFLAGTAGMALFSPIMGLLGWAWGKMSDDEDWPEELRKLDFLTWFHTVALPEKLGDVKVGGVPVSDLIERGPLNAITGEDIGSRVGLNDLWGRDSKETKTARDSAIAYMLDHFAGPTASLALSFADAFDAYAMGDYQKMQEKLAPAAIRNLLVAKKYADEGMKTGRGVELVGKDDVKTGELIGQAIGFRPDILAATQGPSFKLAGVEQRILNQRGLILNKLDFQLRQNTDKGDENFNEIMENEVVKFNVKYPSYALDADAIYNSLEKKAEQRAGSRAGVITTEKNIPIIEEATDTLEKRLDARAAEMKARREKNPR